MTYIKSTIPKVKIIKNTVWPNGVKVTSKGNRHLKNHNLHTEKPTKQLDGEARVLFPAPTQASLTYIVSYRLDGLHGKLYLSQSTTHPTNQSKSKLFKRLD